MLYVYTFTFMYISYPLVCLCLALLLLSAMYGKPILMVYTVICCHTNVICLILVHVYKLFASMCVSLYCFYMYISYPLVCVCLCIVVLRYVMYGKPILMEYTEIYCALYVSIDSARHMDSARSRTFSVGSTGSSNDRPESLSMVNSLQAIPDCRMS